MNDELKDLYSALGNVLDALDSAIGIRNDNGIEGLQDLDLLRNEIHEITCRKMFEEFAK